MPRYYISVLRPAVVVFLSFSKHMLEQYINFKDGHFLYTLQISLFSSIQP